MSKEILKFSTLSRTAWQYFLQDKKSWVLLASFYISMIVAKVAVNLYEPEYMKIIIFIIDVLMGLCTAILYQNGLDAVYGRKLSMVRITLPIVYASLFFLVVSSYNAIASYAIFLSSIYLGDFYFLPLLSFLISIGQAITFFAALGAPYFLIRLMFVGMLILEKKSTIQDLFYTSFAMTKGHILSLLKIIIYLSIIFVLSLLTVIGAFIALPYYILLQSLIFKQLYEKIDA